MSGERDAVAAAPGEESLRLLVVWGVDDALDRPLALGDEQSTFCGQIWGAFLQRTGIRADDLWFDSKVRSLYSYTVQYEYENEYTEPLYIVYEYSILVPYLRHECRSLVTELL